MGRFLVVDDNTELAESLCDILTFAEGGSVSEVALDGREAVERVARRNFDVAFIDLHLPDARGTDLVSRLREASPLLQVVIITGDGTLESAINAVRTNAFAYVVKPIRSEELIDTARRALGQARAFQEREQLRRELESSEKRHREVVEGMPAFVLALDAEGNIVLWNRRLEEATGYSREVMLGQPGGHLVGEDGTTRRLPLMNGGHRIVRWHRTTVSAGEDRGVVYAMGIDVTDEREMLRRTVRAERLAAVGTLAAGLAHEVRNPLNSAQLQLDLLERRVGKGNLSVDNVLATSGVVREEIRRLDRLVSDFLAFAQPRPLDLKLESINQLVQGVVDLVGPEVAGTGIALSVKFDPDAGSVRLDPSRFRQVLLNLLRNATEAMGAEGTLRVTTRGPDASGNVTIEVADTGPGFPEDAPIFDAFYTTKEGGTGLGLAIVHRIVSDHGGTIQVRSSAGNTRFCISLPQHPEAP